MSTRSFVLERFGQEEWIAVLASLGAEDRATVESVVSMGWYETALFVRLNHAVARTLGNGDVMAIATAMGRHSASHDLTTIHRVFLRLASPAFILEKAGELWRRYHDTGAWTVVRNSKNDATARLVGWGAQDRIVCDRLTAYLQRLLELVGATDAHVVHPRCERRGDPECIFEARWK